jgi:hypothetical protein
MSHATSKTSMDRRVWRCGLCNVRCRTITSPGGLCRTCRRQPALLPGLEPELRVGSGAVYRTARQPWRCQCDGSCGELTRDPANRTWCGNPACLGVIVPGDRYVEYLGEAEPYRSGRRYCRPCGVAAWCTDPAELVGGGR